MMTTRTITISTLAGLLLSARGARAGDDDALYACKAAAAGAKMSVSFKPDTSIYDLSVWLAGFTCKNVVFSADVAKRASKVTVIAPATVTPKQAVKLFTDAVEALGLTVTLKGDTYLVKLGPGMPRSCPDLPDATVAVAVAVAPADVGPSVADAELDAGIKKVDDLHYTVTRAVLAKLLSDPTDGRGVRIVPSVKDGKPNGWKLYAIRPSSPAARLGFANGDTVQAVNGHEVLTLDQALEVREMIKDAQHLEVGLIRRGKPATLTITLK